MGAAARRLRALGTAARRRQPGLRTVARRRPCALGRRRGGDRTSCGRRRGSGCASWGRRRGGGRTGWRRRRGKAACAARGWRRRRRGMAGGGIGRTAAARRAGVLIGPARHGKWAFVPCPGPDLRHVGRPGTARIIKRANRAGPNRAGPGPCRAGPAHWPTIVRGDPLLAGFQPPPSSARRSHFTACLRRLADRLVAGAPPLRHSWSPRRLAPGPSSTWSAPAAFKVLQSFPFLPA